MAARAGVQAGGGAATAEMAAARADGRRGGARWGRTGYTLQIAGIGLCALLGVAMIVNNQMGGEAMWFWYATVFHRGARLYTDLHVALQPLFLLLTDAWIQMFGHRLAVMELPSLLQIVGMGVGILLVLRESDWPDWQKAIVLVGVFGLTVSGNSYRFDDYHILAENLILYAVLVLLWMARAGTRRTLLVEAGLLGVVAGMAVTTRVTDGVALVGAALCVLPFLLRRDRVTSMLVMLLATAVTVLVVVRLTGDTFGAYLSSTVLRAAGSKGGTGSIFAAPFLVLGNVLPILNQTGKRIFLGVLLLLVTGPLVAAFWRRGLRHLFALQVGLATLTLLVTSAMERRKLLGGTLIQVVVLGMIPLLYVVAVIVLARFAKGDAREPEFNRREILVLLPLAEWASYSAGAAAEPLTNYYAPMALLLLLFPVIRPMGRWRSWAYPTFLTLMALLGVSSFTSKWITPYSWQNYHTPPFFKERVWYRHPVYGPMYIDKDLLSLSERVCADIGAVPGKTAPAMLSLPYPFPNYFCDTPPWHNYVQTFFDTSTRATIEQLMRELNANPPEWVVYQRQLNIMKGAERLYNHSQPLAQRDLDRMIQQKVASGQWVLVDEDDYLNEAHVSEKGWYIFRTHR